MSERDKFLTEAMDECWHDDFYVHTAHGPYRVIYCNKCKVKVSDPAYYSTLSTWEGFGTLWEWAQKQGWWRDFCDADGMNPFYYHDDNLKNSGWLPEYLINPDRFADAIHEYLRQRGNS
jgi:hypothetical protein